MLKSEDVLRSWCANAARWVACLRSEQIASRRFTNPAIVEAVVENGPTAVCDLGAGEGWLTRALLSRGIPTAGFDATPALVEAARESGLGQYKALRFEAIAAGRLIPRLLDIPYEAAVFNFCLYGKEETEALLRQTAQQLGGRRLIFIQTLHPHTLKRMGLPVQSQWIDDCWSGLSGGFTNGHPYYFRTLEDWRMVFDLVGLNLLDVQTPGPEQPLSLLFTLTTKDS